MRTSNKSRSRNKGNRRSNGNVVNRVFESSGPDGKVRGNPQQIIDKYQAMARDAFLAGDRVAGESYSQHSEHYVRILGEAQRQKEQVRQEQQAAAENSGRPADVAPEPVGQANGADKLNSDSLPLRRMPARPAAEDSPGTSLE